MRGFRVCVEGAQINNHDVAHVRNAKDLCVCSLAAFRFRPAVCIDVGSAYVCLPLSFPLAVLVHAPDRDLCFALPLASPRWVSPATPSRSSSSTSVIAVNDLEAQGTGVGKAAKSGVEDLDFFIGDAALTDKIRTTYQVYYPVNVNHGLVACAFSSVCAPSPKTTSSSSQSRRSTRRRTDGRDHV